MYRGSTEISYIEIDKETTNANLYHGGEVAGEREWLSQPPTYIEDLNDEDIFKYLYSENNILKIKLTEFDESWTQTYVIDGLVGIKVHFVDGTVENDVIDFLIFEGLMCLAEGTQITLADRTTKAIEDITYEDDLLVWDFDNARFATAKPLWIMKQQIASQYNLLKFANGLELKTIDQHRIFNKELGKFSYPMTDETPVGTTTFTDNGEETTLISKEVVKERVNYYNIITDYHMNLFASGILTSCRLSNLYKIQDMKYIKDNRELVPKEAYPTVPQEYYNGLRLAEQPKEVNRGNDVEHSKDLAGYVQSLINKAKPKA